MLKFLIFLAIAVCAVSADFVEIPENLRNAKDINEHPDRQEILRKNFPQYFPSSADKNTGTSPQIIGGNSTTLGQIPHQVLIFIHFANSVYMCGGSIIKLNWVVTAAHCVYDDFKTLQLFFGTITTSRAEQEINVDRKSVIIHPNYIHEYLRNDIAVIKINPSSNFFQSPNIGAVELPVNYTSELFVGTKGRVSGFGRFSDNSQSVSPNLKHVDLQIVNNIVCTNIYGSLIVQNTNICAETKLNASSCNGDSGGPLTTVVDGKTILIGIVSFGAKDGCELAYPAGFTRVTSFLDWIQKNTNASPKSFTINIIAIVIAQLILLVWKM